MKSVKHHTQGQLKGVENLAKYRGSQCGKKFAEAFELLRDVN